MSRRKDWDELSPRAQYRYRRALERAYGKKRPTFVPDVAEWPESSRAILRAAIQAWWANEGDEAKGIVLAKSVKRARQVKHAKVWPSLADGELWLKTAKNVEPRAAYLLAKICLRRGLRSEEVLATPRAAWEAAVRWGQLKFIGKGNKERVLVMTNFHETIREMLDTPGCLPHDKWLAAKLTTTPKWTVPGEMLARPGSAFETQHNLFARYIKKVAKVAGLDPTQWKPHALRHLFSTRYLDDGGSERALQEALGHASLDTVAIYTHPTPEKVAKHFRGED